MPFPPPIPTPPPPPPPSAPPLLSPSKDCSSQHEERIGVTVNETTICSSEEEQNRKIFHSLKSQGLLPLADKELTVVSCYNPITPVLQNGPVCGLVALSMASQLANGDLLPADDILSEAKRKTYSKQGEMFSVTYLKDLCSTFLHFPSEILHLQNSESQLYNCHKVMKQILQRNILLVPYDADKNHSPCEKKGHKAHWALIAGLTIVMPSSHSLSTYTRSVCRPDPDVPGLYHWPKDPPLSMCQDLSVSLIKSRLMTKESAMACDEESRPGLTQMDVKSAHTDKMLQSSLENFSLENSCLTNGDLSRLQADCSDSLGSGDSCDYSNDKSNVNYRDAKETVSFYVLGHQGKSKHVGVWSLDSLLDSNAQLTEAGPDRDSDSYVIPPGGVVEGLRSQALLIKLNGKE